MAKSTSPDRRSLAASLQEQQRRAERRRSLLIIGPAVLVAAVLVGSVAYALVDKSQDRERTEQAAAGEIDGVTDYPDLSRNHVEGAVDYPQTPPVGGDHAGVWVNCGSYADPVPAEMAVHTLEHGAVWIAHQPDLPAGEVEQLTALAEANDFVLVSPVEGATSPVVATAWGKQLLLDRVDDERLAVFVTKYANGPQTPEPGAPCTGGVGEG